MSSPFYTLSFRTMVTRPIPGEPHHHLVQALESEKHWGIRGRDNRFVRDDSGRIALVTSAEEASALLRARKVVK